MAIEFGEIIRELERFQIVDMLIFLLIFTILFAVLEKTKVLGESKKNLNVGFSLLFSLVVLFVHFTAYLPPTQDPFEILKKALPQVSLLVVAVMALLILLGVFAHDKIFLGLAAPGWIAFVCIVTIIFIFGSAAGWWAPTFMGFLEGIFGSDAITIVIMILIFGIIIAFITGSDSDRQGMERAGIYAHRLFGGGGGGRH